MIRFILFLLNKQGYETCQSCETLKQERNYLREENKRLTDTILNLVNPKVYESSPTEIIPVVKTAGLFSRRREAAEQRDREAVRVARDSNLLGKPDKDAKYPVSLKPITQSVEQLEQELGVESNNG